MNGGPMSPCSQDEFSSGYDMNSHIKRKELFTQRKQREFIPDNKKDDSYWDRRRRNNEAAKRSREKRRYNDMVSISIYRYFVAAVYLLHLSELDLNFGPGNKSPQKETNNRRIVVASV